jgi:hypothetical protein
MATTTAVGSAPATTTYNIDVHSVVRRYNRFIVEIQKSQSSGISQSMPYDVTRIKSYIASMNAFLNFIVSQPLLDCPETGPTEMPLPPHPTVVAMENDSAYDLLQLIEIARDEIVGSQSSRLPTNLLKFDYDRQIAYLAKLTNLLQYVANVEPLDLPESSPMDAVTGTGQQGV